MSDVSLSQAACRLMGDGFLDDPYPAYAALREAGPIHWSEEFYGGAWLLTRHDDVEAMLRDPRFSARRTGGWLTGLGLGARDEFADFQRLFARAMLFVDAPDHRRLRGVLAEGFRADAVGRLRTQVASLVDKILGDIDASRGFDFVEQVAQPLPALAIASLMGVGEGELEDFVSWSRGLSEFIGAPQPTLHQARLAQVGLLAMGRYFETRTGSDARPSDDLVGRLMVACREGRIEAGAELLAQCAMLLFAGHETTRHLLANGMYHLLSNPEIREQLRDAPQRWPAAVRELLRFDSPVQYTARRLTVDTPLHGQPCRRGDLVIGLIGSANRDPRRHGQPDRIDLSRPLNKSLAFGSGPHACIGAGMALAEAEVVLSKVLCRWPDLQLVHPVSAGSRSPLYRGRSALRVFEA